MGRADKLRRGRDFAYCCYFLEPDAHEVTAGPAVPQQIPFSFDHGIFEAEGKTGLLQPGLPVDQTHAHLNALVMLNTAAQHAHQRMIDLYLCGRSLMDQIPVKIQRSLLRQKGLQLL
ncbi:hypothetical protein D3C86_1851170 [compost metagenome]